MLRTALYSLGCSVLILGLPQSQALGCPGPPESWTQASANGEFELSVNPEYVRRERGLVLDGARYRLERVGVRRETVWEVRAPELHGVGFVANDGDYVVTARPWRRGDALTIRNSAGAVIRSLAEEDVVSIAEQLEGASWSLKGLDASQEYLEIEVAFFNDSYEQLRSISRQIQLMDGYVLDAPSAPPGFQIPQLACSAPARLRVFAIARNLTLVCIDDPRTHEVLREYEFADERFRLVMARDFGGGDGRQWRARVSEDEPGPCETIYRDGEVVSERCGPDVTSPPQ